MTTPNLEILVGDVRLADIKLGLDEIVLRRSLEDACTSRTMQGSAEPHRKLGRQPPCHAIYAVGLSGWMILLLFARR